MKIPIMNSCRVSDVEPEVPELFAAGQAQRGLPTTTTAYEAMESAGLSALLGNGEPCERQHSMAMQKTTVATPLTIDGLSDGRAVLLGQDAQSFAERVIRLLGDEQERRRLGANSLACVRGKYSWRALGQSLEGALRAVAVPTSPRPGPT